MVNRGRFLALGLMTVLAIFCVVDDAMGQRNQRNPFARNSGLGLLGQENVQRELELVEDQLESIRELQTEQSSAMRDKFVEMREKTRNLDGEDRNSAWGEVRKEMEKLNQSFDKQLEEILLPHQQTRLKQIVFQSQARRTGGVTRGAIPDALAKELSITDEQKDAMKAKAEEIRKEMQEKIAKITAEATDQILSVLTTEQQKKYKELVGERFEFGTRGGNQRGRGRNGNNRRRGGGGDDR